MTEYDFSPEAYERYIRGQQRIRRWVHRTDQTPKADPYQAATPPVDVPKELLPRSRIWDSNPPWSAQLEKKKPKKHRTHSEKEFDRERRNDWKYSHREHMDALRAATAHPQTSRAKRVPYDGTAPPPPPPLQSRSLHPRSRYPADHRFSDSQDTSSSSEHAYVKPPDPSRKRASSVQAPIRVPLPGPLPGSMPLGPLPGPMPLPGPAPFYVHGPEINAQVVLDDEQTGKSSRHSSSRRNKPVRSQTLPDLPAPPASAPVYPSQQYQGHNHYYSNSSPLLHRPQQGSQPRPAGAYPYPYAPSPLAPPNSAPAYSYPRLPVGFIPEPLKSSERKLTSSEPFIKRMFLNFANQRKADGPTGETKERVASRKAGPNSPSPPSTPSPTSFTKSRTWLGSPVKNKLVKTTRKEPSETPRSKSSLHHHPRSASAEAARTRRDEWGMSRGSLNNDRERERERARERAGDRTREKENRRDERGKEESRGREHGSHERRKERNGKENDSERDKERDKSRRRDRSRSVSLERHKHRRERDRERDDHHQTRHHHHRERTRSFERDRDRAPDREPEGYKDRDRGRDRTPRHSRPREKTARE